MRALGIDPGTRVTGWGVVESAGPLLRHLASGTVCLGGVASLGERLARLQAECLALIDTWSPSVVVLERAFVARNVQSALRLGEARGAILAAVGVGGRLARGVRTGGGEAGRGRARHRRQGGGDARA